MYTQGAQYQTGQTTASSYQYQYQYQLPTTTKTTKTTTTQQFITQPVTTTTSTQDYFAQPSTTTTTTQDFFTQPVTTTTTTQDYFTQPVTTTTTTQDYLAQPVTTTTTTQDYFAQPVTTTTTTQQFTTSQPISYTQQFTTSQPDYSQAFTQQQTYTTTAVPAYGAAGFGVAQKPQPAFKLLRQGSGISPNEQRGIVSTAMAVYQSGITPISNNTASRIKKTLGGDWIVIVYAQGKPVDFNMTCVQGNDYMYFTLDNMAYQVCRLR